MPNSNKLLAVAVLLLLVMCVLPSQTAGRIALPASNSVRFLVSPISTWLHLSGTTIRPVHEPAGLIPSDSEALREELDKVWQYNRRLEQELEDARKTIQHLGHMRQMMPDTQTDLVVGRVIGTNFASPSPSITLDIGSTHNLRTGLAVVSGFNLVGQVTEVQPQKSLVKPITAPDTLINLRIVPPSANEPSREGFVSAKYAGDAFVGTVGANDPIKLGDLAHLYDESWPAEARGFVVGSVISLEPLERDPLLRKKIRIQPLRSPTALDRVVVLLPTENDRPKPAPATTDRPGRRADITNSGWDGSDSHQSPAFSSLNTIKSPSQTIPHFDAGRKTQDSGLPLSPFNPGPRTLDSRLSSERRG